MSKRKERETKNQFPWNKTRVLRDNRGWSRDGTKEKWMGAVFFETSTRTDVETTCEKGARI